MLHRRTASSAQERSADGSSCGYSPETGSRGCTTRAAARRVRRNQCTTRSENAVAAYDVGHLAGQRAQAVGATIAWGAVADLGTVVSMSATPGWLLPTRIQTSTTFSPVSMSCRSCCSSIRCIRSCRCCWRMRAQCLMTTVNSHPTGPALMKDAIRHVRQVLATWRGM